MSSAGIDPCLTIFCPACGSKYAHNATFVCPFCGYELITAPLAGEDEAERQPELYLKGIRELIAFIPYFESNPRIETDTRTRPERMLPAEIRTFKKILFNCGIFVHDYAEVIRTQSQFGPKHKLDLYALDILGLRSVLTLIFQRERDLGLISIAEAVASGVFTVLLVRLQNILTASGILEKHSLS